MLYDFGLLFAIPIVLLLSCLSVGYLALHIVPASSGHDGITGKNTTFGITLMVGYIVCVGSFHVVSLPFMYFEAEFSPLYYIWIFVMAVSVSGGALLYIRQRKGAMRRVLQEAGDFWTNKGKIALFSILLFCAAFQVIRVVYFQHTDIDDSYYLAEINTILHTDKILNVEPASGIEGFQISAQYKLVSYEVLLSVIIKLFRVNTAYFAHTVLPVFLIFLHYVVVYAVARAFSEKNAPYFAAIYCVLSLFGNFSIYNQETFLMCRIWQGKAVMINMVYPVLLWCFASFVQEKRNIRVREIVFLALVLLAGMHTTTVGLYLMPIAYFTFVCGTVAVTRDGRKTMMLCIPVIAVLPAVLLKAWVMFGSGSGTDSAAYTSVTEISEDLNYAWEFIEKFMNGNAAMPALYIAALALVFFCGNAKEKATALLPPVALTLTFLNPLLMDFVANHITGVPVYWRLFWLLEMPWVITIAFGSVVRKRSRHFHVIWAVWMFAAAVSGMYVWNRAEKFEVRQNRYKLDERAVTIANEIHDDMTEEEATLLLPLDWSYGIREYCGDIKLLLNRYTENTFTEAGRQEDLERLNEKLVNCVYVDKSWDRETLESEIRYFNIDYMVFYSDSLEQNELPETAEAVYRDEEYVLVKIS